MATGGLVAIFAHPDDETFGVGGTMASFADRGVPVTMVSATRGEVGEISPGTKATPETLGAFREQELRDAMAILGVTDVRFLDFRDSGMDGTDENAHPGNLMNAPKQNVVDPLVRIMRERRPEIVVTWDLSGGYGHPDHVTIHRHATAAFEAAADPSSHADAGDPWRAEKLYYVAFPMEKFTDMIEEMRRRGYTEQQIGEDEAAMAELPRVEPNCIIDVTGHFERKMKALLAHRTQLKDLEGFRRLPEDLQRDFFGREYFHRARPPLPPGVLIEDMTADA